MIPPHLVTMSSEASIRVGILAGSGEPDCIYAMQAAAVYLEKTGDLKPYEDFLTDDDKNEIARQMFLAGLVTHIFDALEKRINQSLTEERQQAFADAYALVVQTVCDKLDAWDERASHDDEF
jgi:hypothetical protein